MMFKKKEGQSIETLVLLRRRKIMVIEGDAEKKCGADTEGKTIQRLPHLGMHPIYSYNAQALLWMPTSAD